MTEKTSARAVSVVIQFVLVSTFILLIASIIATAVPW